MNHIKFKSRTAALLFETAKALDRFNALYRFAVPSERRFARICEPCTIQWVFGYPLFVHFSLLFFFSCSDANGIKRRASSSRRQVLLSPELLSSFSPDIDD